MTLWNWLTLVTIWLVVLNFWSDWYHVVKRHPATDCHCTHNDGAASREAGGLGSDLAGSGGGSGVQFPGPTDPPPSEQPGEQFDGSVS